LPAKVSIDAKITLLSLFRRTRLPKENMSTVVKEKFQGVTFLENWLAFSRIVDSINERFGRFADWMVLLSASVSALNAGVRYLFNYSSNGFLEVQWYMFGAMVLLGASYTLKMNEHVRVDVVYASVSDRTRLWIDTIGFIVFLIPITAFLAVLCWPFFWKSFLIGEMSPNAGGLISWPAKLLLPIGFALLMFQGLSELIKRIAALRGVIEVETKYEKPLQ
jgi:TRAP-type mannitol/chloroaromatic compound transport system permease small subunit